MMPNWTKQQEQAIRARNHTILVSAAAGSGKTAVLVERIVSLVREGASMNRMLIVTFTKWLRMNAELFSNQRSTADQAAVDVFLSQQFCTVKIA